MVLSRQNRDDFYNDEEGRSPSYQVNNKVYNELLLDPRLLAPVWY